MTAHVTVSETLAAYVTDLRDTDIPGSAITAAKRCLLDWYGATISGGVIAPATALAEALAPEGAPTGVRLIPSGRLAEVRTAAFINATASHSVEVDDIYRWGIYHPGSPVIAAAQALAEHLGASGEELLRAIIAGYEVSNRIAAAVVPAHYHFWHTTATVGHFGAAAAASYLLRLTTNQTAHAIATTGTLAAGLKQAFRSDSMSKPLHVGRAAEAGVMAALSAKAGVTGVLDMLEGEVGFGAAMCPDVNWDDVTTDLGQRFTIEQMTQKYHACCGHSFAVIDASAQIATDRNIDPADIADVHIMTYAQGVEVCGIREPSTPYEAKFSLPYLAATGIMQGRAGPSAFTPERITNEATRALMAKVRFDFCPDCEAAFPARRSATVAITLKNGTRHEFHRPTRKGDPDDPLSTAELSAKYRELADSILSPANAAVLEEALWAIDKLGNVADLPLPAPTKHASAAE